MVFVGLDLWRISALEYVHLFMTGTGVQASSDGVLTYRPHCRDRLRSCYVILAARMFLFFSHLCYTADSTPYEALLLQSNLSSVTWIEDDPE